MSQSPTNNASSVPTLPLATALVRLSRERGIAIERLQAEQLLNDAESSKPGYFSDLWTEWTRQAVQGMGLRARLVQLPLKEAVSMAANGLLAIGSSDVEGEVVMLLGAKRGQVQFATRQIDGVQSIAVRTIKNEPSFDEAAKPWVLVDRPQINDAVVGPGLERRPVRRFLRLLRPEWSDIGIILTFAFFVGLLSLATPIAVESLVNTVAFGRMLQPVVVLAALLFGFLAFAGFMRAMQIYVVEIIQRRLFTRVAADLAFRLPRVESSGWKGAYRPELVNRFLDVVTLQKVTAELLTGGVGIVLATIVGMTVLAFYHPWLLGFDVLLLFLIVAGLVGLGQGAIPAAIKESKLKYRLTSWFEDIVRCPNSFMSQGGTRFANDRASRLTTQYLAYRKTHFDVFFRQLFYLLGLQAVAGTVLLGGGGWLVIRGQLTLGQLVAAELIVMTILNSLIKLGKHIDGFYDVVAAVDKLGMLFDLPIERIDGQLSLPEGRGVRLRFSGVTHPWCSKTPSAGFQAAIDPCERVALFGGAGSGKTSLLRLLYGLERPASGHVEIEHADPRDLRPDVLRENVGFAGDLELFEGTIAENVHVRRPSVTANDVREALFSVGLLDTILQMPEGLETPINASGVPLSRTQQRLLMLARAIVSKPRLLLIDGVLDSLPDDQQSVAIEALINPKQPWTLVVATGHSAVAESIGRVIQLSREDVSDGMSLTSGGVR